MDKHANTLALEAIFRHGNVAFIKTRAGYGFIVTAIETKEVHNEALNVHGIVSDITVVGENGGTRRIAYMPEHIDTLIEYRGFGVMGL